MSFVKKVMGFALGGALGGESRVNEKPSTGIRVSHRVKATSEMGIQVGPAVSKTIRKEQMRYQRMSDAWRRLRDTAATQNEASSTIAARLTDQAEDYHIGKVISKLLKPEKNKTDAPEQHTCSVCLDSVCDKSVDITRTSCGHIFHLSCLLKSLKMKNTCPMCRGELENSRPSHPATAHHRGNFVFPHCGSRTEYHNFETSEALRERYVACIRFHTFANSCGVYTRGQHASWMV